MPRKYESHIKVGDTLKQEILLSNSTGYDLYYAVFNNDTLKDFEFPMYKECFKQKGKYIRKGKVFYRWRNNLHEYDVNFIVFVE
jgi:hypothetical protein